MSDRITSSATRPFLLGPSVRWEKQDGSSTEYTYEGTQAECQQQALILRNAGAHSVLVGPAGNGNWRVEGSFPGSPLEYGGAEADAPVNQHELDTIAESVPWNKSDRVRSFFDATRAEEIVATVAHHIGLFQSGNVEINNAAISIYANAQANLSTDLGKISGATAGEIVDAKKLMAHVTYYGFETFFNYNTVYSRSITAATYAQVRAAYTGVGKVFTSAEVAAFEFIPESQWFALDTSLLWLKGPPRVSSSSGGRTQIAYYYTANSKYSKFQAAAYNSATLIN